MTEELIMTSMLPTEPHALAAHLDVVQHRTSPEGVENELTEQLGGELHREEAWRYVRAAVAVLRPSVDTPTEETP